jgi:nicotinamidase-related amidase
MNPSTRTLLQIAGAPLHASPLERSALVLIDPQLEYVTGALPLKGIDAAVDEAARLLALARAQRVPVFHVVHHGRPGGPAFDPQGPYVASIPALAPQDGEAVIVKSLPNAFAGTDLHRRVQETGRKELIIAGFATHMCISATTRAALDLGYRSTVVAGATATRDLPHPSGRGVTPAEMVHEATLAALADRFAVVVPDTAALAGATHPST